MKSTHAPVPPIDPPPLRTVNEGGVEPKPTYNHGFKKVLYNTRWVPADEFGCRTSFFGRKLILQRKYYQERKPVWPYQMANESWERTGEFRFEDATINDAIDVGNSFAAK